MAYDIELAERVRSHLSKFPDLRVEEKKMFGGLAFMVNGKMCINVSGRNLMCRFDPELTGKLATKPGFLPMIMKGRKYKGYGYVEPVGFKDKEDFEYWVALCLDYNRIARAG